MKFKHLDLLIFLLFFNWFSSQTIHGTIISNETKQPVPFAKIGIQNETFGAIADEKGNFSLDFTNVNKSGNLIVEVAGFKPYQISVGKFISQNKHQIFLEERISDIPEIVITPKKFKDANLGYNSKSKSLHIDYLSKNSVGAKKRYTDEELSQPQSEIAISIEPKKNAKLLKIHINFAQFTLDKPLPTRFNIYDEKDGKPNQLINSEDLVFEISKSEIKDGVFTLDVSKKNIWLKGKYFISFQPLDRNFEGNFFVSAGFLGKAFQRSYLEPWRVLPASIVPAINVDVKIEK
ncbi:carboxypeptidase-like regulatory domain-containing protein [uncultured Chryseobacterium sp.]|uniref:carboxypeptidase-like regulatory domain-containing protein n=1 Tax=uncultured Chryseobacterium sp. TaxID=259322 RepID=UPI0026305EC3|nr:carboxypeptidase-like regulatory domain-containing protein [uncultured Chryseobacterium sp.]